jgi:hypothetical protein
MIDYLFGILGFDHFFHLWLMITLTCQTLLVFQLRRQSYKNNVLKRLSFSLNFLMLNCFYFKRNMAQNVNEFNANNFKKDKSTFIGLPPV